MESSLSNLMDVFEYMPWMYYMTLGVLGLCVGSFINVVVFRWPVINQRFSTAYVLDYLTELFGASRVQQLTVEAQQLAQDPSVSGDPHGMLQRLRQDFRHHTDVFNLAQPRSRCGACGTQLRWYHNIPVLSFIALRARCHACHAAISWRYPLVELIAAGYAIACGMVFGVTWATAALLVFGWLLWAMSLIDWDTMLLPDDMTLGLLWLGLLVNFNGLFVPLSTAVLGAMAGYMVLWSIYWIFKLLTGKEGMGYGDFKLLAALGAWQGWEPLVAIVLVASLSGVLFTLARMAQGQHARHQPFPFGPWLALGGLVTLFSGQSLYSIYSIYY